MATKNIGYPDINNNPLFDGLSEDELDGILECAGARTESFDKGEVILREQSETDSIGIMLSGAAHATRLEPSGRRLILAQLKQGDIFGEILSLGGVQKSPVTVTVTESAAVLLIPIDGILVRCANSCARHDRLLRNLLGIVSRAYFGLHERLGCIMRPTLRDKLLFYLGGVASSTGSRTFDIPFDRQTLAEYLNAERSAVSRELSRMKRDGIIDYYKNTFKLL